LVTVKVNPVPVLHIVQPAGVCEPNTLNVASVSLGASPSVGTVTYHRSLADARGGLSALTQEQTVLQENADIFVRYAANGCFATGTIQALFYPNVKMNLPSSLIVCEGQNTTVQIPDASAPSVNVVWDFETGIQGNGISQNQGIVSNGPIAVTGSGISASAQGAGAGCSNAISSSGFDPSSNSLSSAVAANEYFEFCIGAAQPGFTFSGVKKIVWSNRSSNTGPTNFALVAADNLTTPLRSGTVLPNGSCETEGGDLPALNLAACYRIYYWAGPSTSSSGTLRIENLEITAQYSGNLSYSFYALDPALNTAALPVSTSSSFDPKTTPASSPDTLWVTNTNNTTGCTGPPERVIVEVMTCSANISDPCICAGSPKEIVGGTVVKKGVFSEIVEVNAPSGQMWKIAANSGLYRDSLLANPVLVGATFIESPAGSGKFYLKGFHDDGKGYMS